MFRQPVPQSQPASPPIQPRAQLANVPASSPGIARVEPDPVVKMPSMTSPSQVGWQANDIDLAHDVSPDRAEIAREATPFFIRGNRGEPSNLSKIDLEKFDEYLKELEALSLAAGGEGNKNDVQKKLVNKLRQIRDINANEMQKMSSADATVRDAVSGIENTKAYTYKVTDLLREAQSGAKHLARKSFNNAEQKQKFECMSALFVQTKRLVRGVGAEKILVDAAKAADAKLMALMGNRPDSSLITTKTVAVSPPKAFSKYTGGEVNSLVVDEQGLLLHFPAKTFSAAGHGTVGVASMTGGVTAVLGNDNFRAAATFSDLVKTTLNESASSSWIKSNGRASRKLTQTLNGMKRGLGLMSAQLYTEDLASNIYSNDKLGKTRVENTFAINNAIQKSSLDADWKGRVDNLVNKFFLPVADDIKIRQEKGLPPPANPYEVITELIKGSYSDHGANFTAQVGKHWNLGKISPGLSATGVLSYDRFHFDMELPSKPSDLLDSTYHQDFRETLKLHDTIMQKLEAAPGSREKVGVFHQYDRMNAKFSELHGDADDRDFTAEEINHFGEKGAIRPVFHRSIVSPSPHKVIAIEESLNDLARINRELVADLATLGSPKAMSGTLKKEIKASKQDIIKRIHSEVWGDTYPGGEKAALKNPEKFKRQTLYNLEMGLGRMGVELAMLNRHQAQGDIFPGDGDLIALNEQYASLKNALTSRDFLGNQNKDFGDSPLRTTALFNRHQIIANVTMVAGANLSSLIYPANVSPSNVAGDLYVKVQAQYENAVNQFDPTREGQFLVLSFELSSGVLSALPPAARLQEHVVHAVSKTAIAAVQNGVANKKAEFSEQSWQEISQHLVGVLGTNVQTGAKTAIKLHRPYDNATWRLQKITESKTQQGGIDGSVPFVEIVVKDSSVKQEQQIVGPDWSINKMTIKYLAESIKKNESMVLNDEMAIRYFTLPNTISQIIDDGMNWTDAYLARQGGSTQDAVSQSGSDGGKKQAYVSDIHRFLGDPALVRSAERAPEVQKSAPGAHAPDVASPLVRMSNLCQQVDPHVDWATTKANWDATKAEIESLKTFDERRAYWSKPKGQALLKTFIDMVGVYTDVTTAVARNADKVHQPTNSGTISEVSVPKVGVFERLRDYRYRRNVKGKRAVEPSRELSEDALGEEYELEEHEN